MNKKARRVKRGGPYTPGLACCRHLTSLADRVSGAVRAEGAHDVPEVRDADVEPTRHGNRLVIVQRPPCHDAPGNVRSHVPSLLGTSLDDLRSASGIVSAGGQSSLTCQFLAPCVVRKLVTSP